MIRLINLKRMNKTPKDLELTVGGRYTYWRDLLTGNKSFGEKAARKIEAAYGLARGALDQVDGPTKPTPESVNQPAKPAEFSPEVALLAKWLDSIADADIKDAAIQQCMQIVLEAKQIRPHLPTPDTDVVESPEKRAVAPQSKL